MVSSTATSLQGMYVPEQEQTHKCKLPHCNCHWEGLSRMVQGEIGKGRGRERGVGGGGEGEEKDEVEEEA